MTKTKQGFIRALIKFLNSVVDSKPTLEGVRLLEKDNERGNGNFIIRFNRTDYLLELSDSHWHGDENPFIQIRDENLNSLVQFTVDDTNFTINKNSFSLKQNRGITIGTKQKGLHEEWEKLMTDLGFNKDKIILGGEFNNPKFELITKGLFKWLRIRTTAKQKLDKKYRVVSPEEKEILKIEEQNQKDFYTPDSQLLSDGKKTKILSTKYERKIKNRSKAIEIHGTKCKACGFNFEEYYGERGHGFIEIHHIVPLSSLKTEIEVNPATDLIPLCSNCHRMIHKIKNYKNSLKILKGEIEKIRKLNLRKNTK